MPSITLLTRSRRIAALALWPLGVAAFLSAGDAHAQRLGGSLAIGDAKALWNDQASELSQGPVGHAAVQLWVTKGFGLQLQGTLLSMNAGDPPVNPRLAPRGNASLYGGSLGAIGRPFSASYDGGTVNAAGLWMDLGGGAVDTGSQARAAIDGHVGFDFWLGDGFGIGPAIGMVYVIQPNDSVRPDDAPIGVFLVHGAYMPLTPAIEAHPKSAVGDRDNDGIPDDVDLCPDEAEDKDGYQDEDGCPDPDNDRDGVPDRADKCPNEAEDLDGFEDKDGCPEADNDKDGIPDKTDKCPNEPEDFDGFEDEDGCPDPDNDQDRIPDVTDKCPNEPETYNGYADEDGCPDDTDIRVVGDQIILDERIYFHVNLRTIQSRSFPLLQRLAKLLVAHPEYLTVSIEGHADASGEEKYNQKLSEDRASEVKAKLVSYGVVGTRLTVVGYGESRPAAKGTSQADLRQNRRVEFRITRQAVKVGTSKGTPKTGGAQ